MHCDTACTRVEFNIKDTHKLAGGLIDGKVCVWDTRVGKNPSLISKQEVCHQERVTSLLWIHSKSNTEFYSGSLDGQLLWWDTRYFNAPVDSLLCDIEKTDEQDLKRSFGCTVAEYEFTIPTRFLVGTEEGYVLYGNKKGKTPTEKLTIKVKCHDGPVYSLERNPFFVKNFMTVGDFCIKIWSEDSRDSAIIWSVQYPFEMTCGTWSRTRYIHI